MPEVQASHWPFYAVLLIGYLVFVYVLGREVWFGLRYGRTAIYWRGRLLSLRKVVYARAEAPWKFGLALAANGLLFVVVLALPLIALRNAVG